VHGCAASQTATHFEAAKLSGGKKMHSAFATQPVGSLSHFAPSARAPTLRQNALFEVCVMPFCPVASAACVVQLMPPGQSVPNGVHVGMQPPLGGGPSFVKMQDVFGTAAHSASFLHSPRHTSPRRARSVQI
jgi:hypothetical protein